ncbi:hypothetical protein GCM10009021_31090 [Halarchaeum nitratireducens]|uniref:Uncharacterized protein n=2 Tax=Halarchaeum nitratireducens TaxID=489913 RepID=A0A830GHG4_9EURY|nr:hypothetical protein GCM10009021_31090 [Halarchaeum nitratireducens]
MQAAAAGENHGFSIVGFGRNATSRRVDGTVQRGYKALGFTDDVPALDDTPERDDPDDSHQGSLF